MSRPGVVLKRPAASNGRFAEQSGLPSDLASGEYGARRKRRRAKPRRKASQKLSERQARKAAAEFQKEQKRHEAERGREGLARERDR
jgi:hypothetical protein